MLRASSQTKRGHLWHCPVLPCHVSLQYSLLPLGCRTGSFQKQNLICHYTREVPEFLYDPLQDTKLEINCSFHNLLWESEILGSMVTLCRESWTRNHRHQAACMSHNTMHSYKDLLSSCSSIYCQMFSFAAVSNWANLIPSTHTGVPTTWITVSATFLGQLWPIATHLTAGRREMYCFTVLEARSLK